MYVYVYIYIYIHSVPACVYIYIYISVCIFFKNGKYELPKHSSLGKLMKIQFSDLPSGRIA